MTPPSGLRDVLYNFRDRQNPKFAQNAQKPTFYTSTKDFQVQPAQYSPLTTPALFPLLMFCTHPQIGAS